MLYYALQRDEAAIAQRKRGEWPRSRNAARRGVHLAFLDESGFLLIPNVRKTWAPVGHTPCLRHNDCRDRVSVTSARTVAPRRRRLGLYCDLQVRNITGTEVITFLRQLLRHLRGEIVPLWDGGNIHRRGDVQAFLRRHPRVQAHRFPGYARELNPDEFVWTRAKRELSNIDHDGLVSLTLHVMRSLQRIGRSQALLRSSLSASDLPWP